MSGKLTEMTIWSMGDILRDVGIVGVSSEPAPPVGAITHGALSWARLSAPSTLDALSVRIASVLSR
jgi:hypothetical protein